MMSLHLLAELTEAYQTQLVHGHVHPYSDNVLGVYTLEDTLP